MNKFNVNDPVFLKSNPTIVGFVQQILPPTTGIVFYNVSFANGNVGTYPETQLRPFIVVQNAWQLLASNRYEGFEKLSLVATFHKVRNTTNNTLSGQK
jgi:hypothetical protein